MPLRKFDPAVVFQRHKIKKQSAEPADGIYCDEGIGEGQSSPSRSNDAWSDEMQTDPTEQVLSSGSGMFFDPFETPVKREEEDDDSMLALSGGRTINTQRAPQDNDALEVNLSPRHAAVSSRRLGSRTESGNMPENATFLAPPGTPTNMATREEDVAQLRLLAGTLNADWKGQDFMAPALARRIRDFQFAQDRRRRRYGDERPWGIIGLYDHLASIRVDVEWAEDAAWRRANGEPYLSWSEFEEGKKKGMNRPFFTYLLLFVCTALMVASFGVNGWKVEALDVNPMIGPSAQTLIKMGAKDSYLIVHANEIWRLFSSIFLHAGLVHFFINMLALHFIGGAIERTHGTRSQVALFGIPAIGGTILSAVFLPEYITVGASGGIFGHIGACLSDILMNWKLLFSDFVTENGKKHRHAMVVVLLILDILLNCLIGLTPYIDNFTHLGGMVLGFLSGLSTMKRLSPDFFGVEQSFWSRTKQIVTRFSGLIVSVIGIIIATIVLLQGDGETNPCPKCAWLSCVPFPPWKADPWWYCDDCGRVTAEIVTTPSLHLELECPDSTSIAVELDADESLARNELEKRLPSYCREYCPNTSVRYL